MPPCAPPSSTLAILVNNADIAPAGTFVEQSPAVWQQVMAVNVTAPMLLAQAASRRSDFATGAVYVIDGGASSRL